MVSYVDVICKVGRWLATARSLYTQSKELLKVIGYFNDTEDLLDIGPDL